MRFIYYIVSSFVVIFVSMLFFPNESQADTRELFEVGETMLNVRSEPSDQAEIIGKLQAGDQLVAFEEKYGWIKTFYDGKEAWVAGHYLHNIGQVSEAKETEEEKIKVVTKNTHIRSGPGSSYSSIGTLPAGKSYRLIETKGEWHQIEVNNGQNGWIASWHTDTPAQEATSASVSAHTIKAPDQQTSSITSATKPLDGYHIMLDPGHGGKDSGAMGLKNVYEKNITFTTAQKIADKLREAGATVLTTRSKDTYISLDRRVELSHSNKTNAFISIHYNAFPDSSVSGLNTFYYSKKNDLRLAENVHTSLTASIDMKDRGILQKNYRVLRTNHAPSILLELGFITNPNDLAKIQSESFETNVAEAVTDGLKNYVQE
ncbi:MAG: N-acetylmuramoyl-L-alanine amidase [Bacillota bacterium]